MFNDGGVRVSKLLDSVVENQDEISLVADAIAPLCCGERAWDGHPAWGKTAGLPDALCRLTAIQLAEDRLRARVR